MKLTGHRPDRMMMMKMKKKKTFVQTQKDGLVQMLSCLTCEGKTRIMLKKLAST
jgi:hypothetical protein